MAAVNIIEGEQSSIKGHWEYNCMQPHFLSQKCLACSAFVITDRFFLSLVFHLVYLIVRFLLHLLAISNSCKRHICSNLCSIIQGYWICCYRDWSSWRSFWKSSSFSAFFQSSLVHHPPSWPPRAGSLWTWSHWSVHQGWWLGKHLHDMLLSPEYYFVGSILWA